MSPITKYASLVFCTAHAHCYCAYAAVDLIRNDWGRTNVKKVLCEWVFRSNYEIRIALNNVVTYADSETIQISSCTTQACDTADVIRQTYSGNVPYGTTFTSNKEYLKVLYTPSNSLTHIANHKRNFLLRWTTQTSMIIQMRV